MTDPGAPSRPACRRARPAIHARLDGEPDADLAFLEAHLADCAECRELVVDLGAIRSALGTLPSPELPAARLEAIWARTSRATADQGRGRPWKAVAVAASVLLLAWLGVARWRGGSRAEPSEAELERARAETRLVLGLTARVLDDAERAVVHRVLGGEVAGALRRVPVRWPAMPPSERRRSDT